MPGDKSIKYPVSLFTPPSNTYETGHAEVVAKALTVPLFPPIDVSFVVTDGLGNVKSQTGGE